MYKNGQSGGPWASTNTKTNTDTNRWQGPSGWYKHSESGGPCSAPTTQVENPADCCSAGAPASDQGGGADHTTVDFQRCSSDRATSLVQGLQPPAKLLRSCLSNSFRRALSIIFTHFHKLSGSGISTNTCCHSCALRQAANK